MHLSTTKLTKLDLEGEGMGNEVRTQEGEFRRFGRDNGR